MYCKKCGKEIESENKFCSNCGAEQDLESTLSETEENTFVSESDVCMEPKIEVPIEGTKMCFQTIPSKSKSSKGKICAAILGVFVFLIIAIAACGSDKEPSTSVPTATQSTSSSTTAPKPAPTPTPTPEPFNPDSYQWGIEYKSIARTPDTYKGQKLAYRGKVIQVLEGDPVNLRVAVGGDYNMILFVTFKKDILSSRVLEDDFITVYGTYMGVYTYESTSGAEITIPWINAAQIEIDGV